MKVVYVNGRFLTQKITGVQRFAIEIMKQSSSKMLKFIFLVPNGEHFETSYDFDVLKVGAFKGVLWEQISLPIFLWKNGGIPLLINLCNTAPILYRNKISTLMDMTPFINPRWFKKTFSLYYQILFPLVAVSSKLIVTISDWSKNDISRILNIEKDKIVNVGCGVTALGSSDLALVKRKSYILAVSSIEPRKNFKFLVDAFNKMNRDVDLIIIGSEGKVFSNPGIKKAIKGSGNIFFTGYVSDEVLAGYYAGALLFIYPSLYEGFGLPPLEAMSAGCPVLVSNASSLPEVCGDAAEYFDPENEGELIQKARELIDNSLLRSELTNKGDEQVKKHNWSNSYKKLEEQLLRHV